MSAPTMGRIAHFFDPASKETWPAVVLRVQQGPTRCFVDLHVFGPLAVPLRRSVAWVDVPPQPGLDLACAYWPPREP